MVSPVYTAPGALEQGLDSVETRADGLIQRARLRAYSELTGLATCTIYLIPFHLDRAIKGAGRRWTLSSIQSHAASERTRSGSDSNSLR